MTGTVPGNDCPECDARLGPTGCPRCGWTAASGRSTRPACAACHEPTRAVALSPDPDDPATQRCPSCHLDALRRRAAPEHDPAVEHCKAELRRLMDHAAVKWATRREER